MIWIIESRHLYGWLGPESLSLVQIHTNFLSCNIMILTNTQSVSNR